MQVRVPLLSGWVLNKICEETSADGAGTDGLVLGLVFLAVAL